MLKGLKNGMKNRKVKDMKRSDFVKIIKLRSYWKIDKRKGNYKLPNGNYLTSYVQDLISEQLELDKMVIAKEGNIYWTFNLSNEEFSEAMQNLDDEIKRLAFEIVL